ncbi:UxaA family hydrolase [Sandarakinorhabdus rubra]|uniref:UxaA family hydrolase n=1 Tax=Sandarakinorhabdus rubra TaxID=2672568 RepID=UPI0013DA4B36|nr:UxaA family hydrolase [Sandarakinorhabdus rubra]
MSAGQPVLLLAPEDNVLIAVRDLPAGQRLVDGGDEIVLPDAVPLGHKLARRPIPRGASVIKYGASIGSATRDIPAGAWVHLHNLASDYLATAGAGDRP